MGGLAVAVHCHAFHPQHFRGYHDFDLFGLGKESKGIHLVLEQMGYSPKIAYNDLHGAERLMFFDKENRNIDVFLDKFRMEHVIDFRERLHLDSLTIPLTDLFLTKVQNTKLAAKDVTDTIALLEDHPLGYTDGREVLNLSHIAELCSDDWGLWRSVTYNLSKVANLLKDGGYETVVDKPKSLEKLASIRHVIDTKQKTLRWKLRSQVGERVQWYFDVEE